MWFMPLLSKPLSFCKIKVCLRFIIYKSFFQYIDFLIPLHSPLDSEILRFSLLTIVFVLNYLNVNPVILQQKRQIHVRSPQGCEFSKKRGTESLLATCKTIHGEHIYDYNGVSVIALEIPIFNNFS